jgi:2-succinyl-5-enolpyruvyl-6-hydroxy-3-cyclohexene-1-carboxylate synthase
MSGENANLAWARSFLDALAGSGVDTVCLAPGSRSTPLVLAAAGDRRLRVVTHLDERSAAFFALGVGKATRRPAVVVTTSGTAAANLFPAVVEASQAGVPLLLLTADRPHRLRDADANQAIDQLRLFGPYVRRFVEVAPASLDGDALRHLRALATRAVAETRGPDPGPVHLNFPFAKPLEPDRPVDETGPDAGAVGPGAPTRIEASGALPGKAVVDELLELLGTARRGLIVAGPHPEPERVGPSAVALAGATGLPLLADPLSGARFGPPGGATVIGTYDLFLRDARLRERLAPDLVIRLGATPTSVPLARLLAAASDVPHVVVDGARRWKDHLAVASLYVQADPGRTADAVAARADGGDPEWRDSWARVDAAASRVVSEVTQGPAEGGGFSEAAVMAAALECLPEEGWLFASNSMPIRDLDAFGTAREASIKVRGNRGASGIDGIVSTALGLSVGSGEPVVAVLGDLAFYHDMNGLLASREGDARVVFVVIHNDGGGIFHLLPIRRFEPEFTNHFAAPHGLDFRHAAALYELPFQEVTGMGELAVAIKEGLGADQSRVVVIRTDREENRMHRERAAERVGKAARAVLNQEGRE